MIAVQGNDPLAPIGHKALGSTGPRGEPAFEAHLERALHKRPAPEQTEERSKKPGLSKKSGDDTMLQSTDTEHAEGRVGLASAPSPIVKSAVADMRADQLGQSSIPAKDSSLTKAGLGPDFAAETHSPTLSNVQPIGITTGSVTDPQLAPGPGDAQGHNPNTVAAVAGITDSVSGKTAPDDAPIGKDGPVGTATDSRVDPGASGADKQTTRAARHLIRQTPAEALPAVTVNGNEAQTGDARAMQSAGVKPSTSISSGESSDVESAGSTNPSSAGTETPLQAAPESGDPVAGAPTIALTSATPAPSARTPDASVESAPPSRQAATMSSPEAVSSFDGEQAVDVAGKPTRPAESDIDPGKFRLQTRAEVDPTRTAGADSRASAVSSARPDIAAPSLDRSAPDSPISMPSSANSETLDLSTPIAVAGSVSSLEAPSGVRAPQLSISAPPGTPMFARSLADQIGLAIRVDLSQAELVLTPESMGPVRVELNMDGRNASMHFAAANPETRLAIEQSLGQLREMLENQGLALADAQVGSGSQRQAQGQRAATIWPNTRADERDLMSIDGGARPTGGQARSQALVDLFA